MPHLQKLLFSKNKGIPLNVKNIKVNQLQFDAYNNAHDIQAHIVSSLSAKKLGDTLKTTVYFSNGSLQHARKTFIDHFTGMLNSTIEHDTPQQLWGSCSFIAPTLPANAQQCAMTGKLENNVITGTLHNQDETFETQIAFDIAKKQVLATGKLDSALGYKLCDAPAWIQAMHDTVELRTTIDFINKTSEGTFALHDRPVKGSWRTNGTGYHAELATLKAIAIPGFDEWFIDHENSALSLTGDFAKDLTGHLQLTAHNGKTQKKFTATVDGSLVNNTFSLKGAVSRYAIESAGSLKPHIQIDYVRLKDGEKSIINLQLKNQPQLTAQGTLNYEHVSQWLPEWISSQIPGSGVVHLQGTFLPTTWQLGLTMHNGSIIIERIFNVITDIKAQLTIDLFQRSLCLHDTTVTLQQGSLTIPYATCLFDEKNTPIFAHIPLSVSQTAINAWQSTIVASGALTLRYQAEKPCDIQGTVTIDKAHIRSAPAPSTEKDHLMNVPQAVRTGKLAIVVNSKKPIHIQTETFVGKASLSCTVSNQVHNPEITGTLTLHEGILTLPSHQLRIMSGTIYSNPHNRTDPLIDIQAETTVDQYIVRVDLTGTMDYPVLHLQSSPPLNEEQIALLLIAGSTESMLNAAAPALLMDNLAHYVTRTLFSSPTHNSLWTKIFKNLSHIKLIPQFNEHASLKGLSGALEIDLSKKLKAKVQKNLMLDEQPSIEFDYKLSDELSIKAFKNERGDLGSVLQMRLKL